MLSALLLITLAFISRAEAAISNFNDWPHLRVSLPDVSIHLRYYGTGPPLLLIHGYPEHSLTWYQIGPMLAHKYTVIIPDLRGMGDSSIPLSYNFTASAAADDLKGVLDFLNITETYVFAHDKGSGVAAAFTAKYPSTVKRLGVSEYALPGFGYEVGQQPTPQTNLYSNWQLNFFAIPDAAQYFIQGREREMLSWYFFHASYSGNSVIPAELLTTYADSIAKPGFLRSGLEYFSSQTVASDSIFFNSTLGQRKIQHPVLALGGEASFPTSALRYLFGTVADNLEVDIVPKSGHWIADENPQWVARRIARFLAADEGIPAVDLSFLDNRVTLSGLVV